MEMQAGMETSGTLQAAGLIPATGPVLNAEKVSQVLVSSLAFSMDVLALLAGSASSFFFLSALHLGHGQHYSTQLISFCILYTSAYLLLGRSQNLFKNKHCLLRVLESSAILRVSVFAFLLAYIGTALTIRSLATGLLLVAWILRLLLSFSFARSVGLSSPGTASLTVHGAGF